MSCPHPAFSSSSSVSSVCSSFLELPINIHVSEVPSFSSCLFPSCFMLPALWHYHRQAIYLLSFGCFKTNLSKTQLIISDSLSPKPILCPVSFLSEESWSSDCSKLETAEALGFYLSALLRHPTRLQTLLVFYMRASLWGPSRTEMLASSLLTKTGAAIFCLIACFLIPPGGFYLSCCCHSHLPAVQMWLNPFSMKRIS